jgi:protein-tyrosine-phosphatase
VGQFSVGVNRVVRMKQYSVLMVCMGNICRSPTAHGVLRHKAQALGLQHSVADHIN